MSFLNLLTRSFRSARPVPQELRTVFLHLNFDIFWFGLLSGTTLAFLGVYAARIGGSPTQIGMLSAVPGLASLMFSLPIGTWLSKRHIGRSVFWSSVLQRAFYITYALLPALLPPGTQVWVVIVLLFVMTVPGTALTVGFNVLFAELVPIDWRGHVFGQRMAILSISSTVFTLIAGQLLERLPFPLGYQVVFALGFLGGALSSLHLFYLLRLQNEPVVDFDESRPALRLRMPRLTFDIRRYYHRGIANLRLDVLNGQFARIMGLLFAWHLAQWMVIPTITPFVVNDLKISDDLIGLAGGLFNMATFFGSLQLNRVARRMGNKRTTGWGIIGVSFFPMLLSLARGPELYLIANLYCGLMWSFAGGATLNYILENVPDADRPAYLAWYSVVMNAAILGGSLIGPAVGAQIGFAAALLLYGMLRLLSGAAILRWG